MDYLTVSEAAEALQLSVPTVKRYIYEGKLKSSKLPGGQHRIPRAEVDRLLVPELDADRVEPTQQPTDLRLAVLERWMSEMQAELERLAATQEVLGRYLSQEAGRPMPPSADVPAEVLVLGPGCQKCNTLYERTERILSELGRDDITLRHVTNIDDIAAFGPVLTPALVVGDRIVLSGRLPADTALKQLLATHLQ